MHEVEFDIQTRPDGFWVVIFSYEDEDLGVSQSGPYDSYNAAENARDALIQDIEIAEEALNRNKALT